MDVICLLPELLAMNLSKYSDIESFTSDPCNPLSCDECLVVVEKTWRCACCKEAKYCSKDCQRKAWTAGHKSYCGKITVTHCPEMGFGVFALKDFTKGDIIVTEKPILNFRSTKQLKDILRKLSDIEKRKIMSLYDYHEKESGKKSFFGVVDTNCMAHSNGYHLLYYILSRFNHSCVPNVRVDTESTDVSVKPTPVVALKDIKGGDELFWNYIVETSPYMTRAERRVRLKDDYGIPSCQCEACLLTGDELTESDANRMKLKEVEGRLETTWNATVVSTLVKRKRDLLKKEGLDTSNNLMRCTRDLMLASWSQGNFSDMEKYRKECLADAQSLHDEGMVKYFSEYDGVNNFM